ncbi:MAG: sulfotransferase [Egibacteraceae bacterium]
MRPSFFIIGANKCGTSSLYRYLVTNPAVLPCAEKEPNFFGQHSPAYIARHLDDYFAMFPTVDCGGPLTFEWHASDVAGTSTLTTVVVDRRPDRRYITGEASANTFHDVPPTLLHEHLPAVKLIVLVRDPVDRAYSHHRMYRRFRDAGWDPGFEVGEFGADIRAELAAYERGERTEYLGPGLYDELLRRWAAVYGQSRIKVLLTEDLGDPCVARRIMSELEDYLELPNHDYGDTLTRRFNRATPAEVPPAERSLLAAFYRPHNDRLRELLGRQLDWD